jgi:N-methylhydantoinase B
VDAITLAVLSYALNGVAEEMSAALVRTAFSPNIKERRDCSSAVFDEKGLLVAQAENIPVHLGATGTLEDAVWERRWVHFAEEGEVRAPVCSREKLPAGAEFPGPAVVEGPESTVLIPPGCRAFVDRFGNLILEV